ncbi:MAG: VWA domain-containing protein [Lautropia sp.]|nr:VWA domain-containing protein [Lautropia sp.]
MSSLKKFTVSAPRPLPVIVLADVSGSMGENGKIQALNASLKEMIATFGKESRLRAEIQVGIISFGGVARTHTDLIPAHSIAGFTDLGASGQTPMGAAFELACELLEDKERIPSRAYRPVLILLSDGLPTDEWEEPLQRLCQSDRAQKATRMAMAIGPDADEGMLKTFANDPEAPIFRAHNARDIHRFFRAVTMSVTSRSTSQNPNAGAPLVIPPPTDDPDLDLSNF